ncbi:DUF7261 family protein [Salinibaculum rarum]|uniref:DUF7261 family protein n=1 Tax=Salinibaculum rarum TaxID=3058903 RepID=UPI00265EF4CF|nr:hypothetical protein [Salinibaculum sp. KK48]
MAHLTDSDRGQIIIVAAFALGVIFIALAVVVNTAIFTGNLATRGQGTSDDDALQYRHEIEQSVGTVITEINRQHDGNDSTHLKNWAKENVTEINIQGGRQKATNGRVATIDYASMKNGTRFVNESGDFTGDTTDPTTWQVASDVSNTRALKFTITDRTALAGSSNAFTLSLNGSNDNYWNMTLFNPSGNRVNVTVSNGDGEVASCTRSGSGSLEVAVTSGLVDGRPCSALTVSGDRDMWFGSGISAPYNITYDNADEIEGDYEGVVDNGLNEANLPSISGPSSKSNAAIYSLNVSYSYETVSMRYETNVRVAPGEPE